MFHQTYVIFIAFPFIFLRKQYILFTHETNKKSTISENSQMNLAGSIQFDKFLIIFKFYTLTLVPLQRVGAIG